MSEEVYPLDVLYRKHSEDFVNAGKFQEKSKLNLIK